MKFNSKLFFNVRLLSVAIVLAFLVNESMGDGLFDKFSIDFGSLFGDHGHHSAGFIKSKAFIEESPEIGFGFHKIPIMLPLPMLIFRKNKHIVSKGVSMPAHYDDHYDGGYEDGY